MVFLSPYPDASIPDLSLTDYVLRDAGTYPERPALVDAPTGRTLTYGQLLGGSRQVAAGLAKRGFRKGEVFAICSPNLPEWPLAFYGVAMAGGITTTVHSLYTAEEMAAQLRDAGAKHLLTVPPFLDRALPAAAAAGVGEVFVFGEAPGATPFAALLQNGSTPPQVEINPREDVVALPYSSGTTGLPKGVMLTHRNLVANMAQYDTHAELHKFADDDTLLGVLPFFHIYGLEVVLNQTLARGRTLVTVPRFELEPFLKAIQDHRVAHTHLVPPILLALARHPLVDQYDLSGLKTISSAAAPLAEDVARGVVERLGCIVYQGFGLTEAGPASHIAPTAPPDGRLGSVGPCLPSTEAMVVNVGTGEALGPGESGEIWVRGPQVMKGYWKNPEATAACLDDEGWLHTGDIGYADDDGYFYVVDRLKELIKYKGENVAPAELEALLLTHPAVADAAVVPSPDKEAGEVPKAFLVRRGEIGEEEVMAWVAERAAPHKRIRRVEFIDEIPKSATGKLLRRVLIQRERAQG